MAVDAPRGKVQFYVYALAEAGEQRRFTVGKRSLRAVVIDGVAAIIENRREAPRPTEAALREQHAVVTMLSRRLEAVLPVRFGALFAADELAARVARVRRALLDALERVRGRVQMTVRVNAPPALPAAGSRPGTAYLKARLERERAVRECVRRIGRVASRFAVDRRVDARNDGSGAAVYHLIDAADVEDYTAAIATLAPSLSPVRITVTGPWPAFAFGPELKRK